MDNKDFNVIKRDKTKEILSYDKIYNRTKTLGDIYNINIEYSALVTKIIDLLYDNIETRKIDELMAQQCASMASIHYDYSKLSALISISNHNKETKKPFKDTVDIIKQKKGYLSDEYIHFVNKDHEVYENMIDYNRNYLIDYFGYKTLERAYLMRHNNSIIENP